MAATPSTRLELGTALPPFRLRDLPGNDVTAGDFAECRGRFRPAGNVFC
jgi:hypothetical protein